MSALIGKAGKKVVGQNLARYAPQDPYYESYTNDTGKVKRRKRAPPPGLSPQDAAILLSVQRRAHYLDKGISLCGMRVGYAFFIGLIPVVGDVADAILNYLLVVRKAKKAGISPAVLQRMLMNNAVSAAVGFVPFVGDILLAIYKANSRNAYLLEDYLRLRGEENLKKAAAEDQLSGRRNVVTPSATETTKNKWWGGKHQTQGTSRVGHPAGVVAPGGFPVEKGGQLADTMPNSDVPKKNFSLFGSLSKDGKARATAPSNTGRFLENISDTDINARKT